MLRKQVMQQADSHDVQDGIAIADTATVLVTSEMPDHPIDYICDGRRGPGGTRWIAEQPGDQTVILAFDTPQTLHAVSLEVEENEVNRTQEITLATSQDNGRTYREMLRQEYNFSPPGTTFQHERWRVQAEGITNLRIWIRPDKGGRPYHATMTSLVLE